jgi:pilus assembly protein CpaB
VRRPVRAARPPTLRRRRPGVRRLLSAGLVAAAAAAGLRVLAPPPPHLVPVVVAAHDLAAGQPVERSDLAVAHWAPGSGPARATGGAAAFVGRVTARPVQRGSALTDTDLLGPGLLAGQPPDLLAVPVRLGDPTPAGLVRSGDRVDLISGAGAAVVSDVLVLADPAAGAGAEQGLGALGSGAGVADTAAVGVGGVLVVGVVAAQAGRLAAAQAAGPLSLAVHPR